MKHLFLSCLILFLTSSIIRADENCSSIECVDNEFKEKHFEDFYNILGDAIDNARGCKNKEKVRQLLEFSTVVGGGTYSVEMMAEFIDKEFMKNPECILSSMRDLSRDARKFVSDYFNISPFVPWSEKEPLLEKYKDNYPYEYYLLMTEKEHKDKKFKTPAEYEAIPPLTDEELSEMKEMEEITERQEREEKEIMEWLKEMEGDNNPKKEN